MVLRVNTHDVVRRGRRRSAATVSRAPLVAAGADLGDVAGAAVHAGVERQDLGDLGGDRTPARGALAA